MNRGAAWFRIGALVAGSILAFWAPVLVLAALLIGNVGKFQFRLHSGAKGFLLFGAITILIDAALLAWSSPGTGLTATIGPIILGLDGAKQGAWGGLRLVAIIGFNLAWLQSVSVASTIEGLRLPRRATLFLAALLLAVQDLGRDFERLRAARQMNGEWPEQKLQRVRAAAEMVTPLMVASVQRARVRRDALKLAGFSVSKWFVPLLALTALSLAGRLALVAVPNVSLVYVVVFAGGLVFGPWIAALAALLAMGVSDVMLSGLVPTAFVNAPAMALVGLLGGAMKRISFSSTPGRIVAFMVGLFATFLFSIAADVSEWVLVPEFRGDTTFLQIRIIAGLAFNAAPAILHGILFAMVLGPIQQAFKVGPANRPAHPSLPTPVTDHL